jgi:DNA primase catalytic subunit
LVDSVSLTNQTIKTQQQTLSSLLQEQNQQMAMQLWSQQALWQKQTNLQEELARHQQATLQTSHQQMANEVTERLRAIYNLWQEQAVQQDQIANLRQQKLDATVQADQEYRERQIQQFTQAQQSALQTIVEHADQTYRHLGEHLQQLEHLFQKLVDGQDSTESGREQFNRLLLQSIESINADSQGRVELGTQLKILISELQARQEQMHQALSLALAVEK